MQVLTDSGYFHCSIKFRECLRHFISRYQVSEKDGYYSYALPKLSTRFDLGFWNGCSDKQVNQQTYDYYSAIPGTVAELYGTEEKNVANRMQTVYNFRVDSYARVGYVSINLTEAEFRDVLAYQEETGLQLLYPMINDKKVKCANYCHRRQPGDPPVR